MHPVILVRGILHICKHTLISQEYADMMLHYICTMDI